MIKLTVLGRFYIYIRVHSIERKKTIIITKEKWFVQNNKYTMNAKRTPLLPPTAVDNSSIRGGITTKRQRIVVGLEIIRTFVLTTKMIKNCGNAQFTFLIISEVRPCAVLKWKPLLNSKVRLSKLMIRWLNFRILLVTIFLHSTSEESLDKMTLVRSIYTAQMTVQANMICILRDYSDIWIWMAIQFNRYGSTQLHSSFLLIVIRTKTYSKKSLLAEKVPASLPTSGHLRLLFHALLIYMMSLSGSGGD